MWNDTAVRRGQPVHDIRCPKHLCVQTYAYLWILSFSCVYDVHTRCAFPPKGKFHRQFTTKFGFDTTTHCIQASAETTVSIAFTASLSLNKNTTMNGPHQASFPICFLDRKLENDPSRQSGLTLRQFCHRKCNNVPKAQIRHEMLMPCT